MSKDDTHAPPPLPGATHPQEPPPVPAAEPGSPAPRGDAPAPARTESARVRTHWPTVLFGALPATYLAFPAGIVVFLGFLSMASGGWQSFALSFVGAFWWAGTISLWIAARSRPTVGTRTAIGLLLGLLATVMYVGLGLMKSHPPVRNELLSFTLLIGPVWVSLMHLNRFRKLLRTDPSALPKRTPKPPPSETSTRRVGRALRILLFGQVFTCCLFGATMISGSAGLGGLMIMLLAFPLALGLAAFSAWAFVRHRPCRGWAATVFLAPVPLSMLLQLGVKLFGEPTVMTGCGRALPWLPLATILLFPHVVGRLIPRLLYRRGACITYIVLQGMMLLAWLLLFLTWQPWNEKGPSATVLFLIVHAVLSLFAGATGLLFSYAGLFRPREERSIGLSITHMALSIPLLAIGMTAFWMFKVFLANPG